MIVVSNASPIINLAAIGHLQLLNHLYAKIIIPQAVYDEIAVKGAGEIGSQEVSALEWIERRSISNDDLGQALKMELDDGEAETIALALELKADLILIDERRGRAVANRFGIPRIGLLGALIEAKKKGLITSVQPLLERLRSQAGFWISDKLYEHILKSVREKQT